MGIDEAMVTSGNTSTWRWSSCARRAGAPGGRRRLGGAAMQGRPRGAYEAHKGHVRPWPRCCRGELIAGARAGRRRTGGRARRRGRTCDGRLGARSGAASTGSARRPGVPGEPDRPAGEPSGFIVPALRRHRSRRVPPRLRSHADRRGHADPRGAARLPVRQVLPEEQAQAEEGPAPRQDRRRRATGAARPSPGTRSCSASCSENSGQMREILLQLDRPRGRGGGQLRQGAGPPARASDGPAAFRALRRRRRQLRRDRYRSSTTQLAPCCSCTRCASGDTLTIKAFTQERLRAVGEREGLRVPPASRGSRSRPPPG